MAELERITDAMAIVEVVRVQRIETADGRPSVLTRHYRALVWDPSAIGERERRIIRQTWPEQKQAEAA